MIAERPPPRRTTNTSALRSAPRLWLETVHGGCTCGQSWPSTMHSPRLTCPTVAAAIARPLRTKPPATAKTSATSATIAMYSTAAWPEVERGRRMAPPCARACDESGRRRHESRGSLLVPGTLLQIAKDDRVATTRDEHLPVAPPQRLVGPPAILDQPRLPHRFHLSAGHDHRPPVRADGDRDQPREVQATGRGHLRTSRRIQRPGSWTGAARRPSGTSGGSEMTSHS